jgi:hypothetical protein
MNKEEQELREKVFQALGKASMCWNPIPSGEFDSSKAQNIGNELMKEIRAILPPRQEVMSEEEIFNFLKEAIKIDMSIAAHGVGFSTPYKNDDGLRMIAHALSGRIAKPEAQITSQSNNIPPPTVEWILERYEKLSDSGKSLFRVCLKGLLDYKAQEPEPQKPTEYCQCKPEERILCRAMECGICHKCNLEIPPRQNKEPQKPVEEINKEQVLRLLHEKDYIRSLHSKIKEVLIGSLRSQYLGNNNYNQVNIAVETPYFRALVDMFTASLIYSTTDKLVEIVIDTIEALRQRVEEGR